MTEERAEYIPAGNNEPSLDDLAAEYLRAKDEEDAAKALRLTCEQAMMPFLDRHPSLAGSKTTAAQHFKVTAKDEPKAKFSDPKLAQLGRMTLWQILSAAGIAEDDMPIKVSYSLDVKKLDALKAAHPELYARIIDEAGIERYQAKTTITVKQS